MGQPNTAQERKKKLHNTLQSETDNQNMNKTCTTANLFLQDSKSERLKCFRRLFLPLCLLVCFLACLAFKKDERASEQDFR